MKKLMPLVLVLMMLITMLAGVGNAARTEIVFWTMWDGGDVKIAKSIFDEYNQKNHKVKIQFLQQDFNQYYTKLKTAIIGGTGPDFAVAHVGGFISGLQAEDNLLALDEAAKKYKVKLNFDKYTSAVMKSTKIDGKYYTVPLDNLIRVLMYNKALLKNTGLLDRKGNLIMEKGFAGFNKALDQVKNKKQMQYPLSLTMRPPQLVLGWLTLYYQMGGTEFLNLETKKATFDDEKALAALKAYKEIYDNYVPPRIAPPADFEMFKTGRTAFYIDGAWMVSASAEALGKDFGVTRFPQLFEKDAHIVTNHGFIIPVKKNRTDAQTKAALEFIKWWADNNWKWSQAGHLPGYLPTLETRKFKELPYPKFYGATLKGAIPIPMIPNGNLHQAPELTGPIQKAMLGDMKPEDAIKEIKKNLNRLLPKLAQ